MVRKPAVPIEPCSLMKIPVVKIALLIAMAALVSLLRSFAEDAAPTPERIGVYDSRSIAVAFVNSESYNRTEARLLAERSTELEKAEAAGDEKRIAELKAWGKARQGTMHEQAFSTAPVDDILKHIEKQLSGIMKEASVDALISKWDTQALAKHQAATQVDVTLALVDAFGPTEKQRGYAVEIQKRPPVPLDELKEHED